MAIGNLLRLALISVALASCASSPVGERHPDAARYACPLDAASCSLDLSKDDWAFEGSYKIDKTDVDRLRVHGRFKVDTTRLLSVYTYSRVIITFYFFRSDEIVEKLSITVRGKVNQFTEFSKTLVTDEKLDSSVFVFSRINVSEAPI